MVSTVPGMRWVHFVRVVDDGTCVRFFAVGTGHRWPCTVRLSHADAAALLGRVPFVGRRT